MFVELECKVRVASFVTLRDKLRAAGADYIGRVLETNRVFDRADGALRNAGCGLRVRSVSVLDGQGPGTTLTYKGPRTASAFKCREEIEVEVDDAAAMTQVLRALGYKEQVIFEKRRESWSLLPCRVELDELPELGTFVEVEGPDEGAIRRVLAVLGLAESEVTTASYVSMVVKVGKGKRPFPVTLHFE